MTRRTLYYLGLSAVSSLRRIDKRWWGLALPLALCCAALAVRAHTGLKAEPINYTTLVPSLPLSSPPIQQGATGKHARVVKFSLFQAGIYPREVHVDPGLVAVTIEDYSGGTAGLVVELEGNATQRAGLVERAGPHWRRRSETTLGPGRYVVYMAERPANRALLVVEP